MMRRRLLSALGLASLLALAAWARVANYRLVLGAGELMPQLDGDSFFHLRRILAAVERFPRVPHFDPAMNWPRGAFVPWSDGFDLAGAAWARALGAAADSDRTRVLVALWPVVIGLLLVAATVRLVRTAAPGARWRGTPLAAGLFVALAPEAVHQTRFARIDHHGFEALVVALLATWVVRAAPRGGPAAPPGRPGAFELEGALVSAAAVYGFSGSPLYVALVVPLLVAFGFRHGRAWGSGGAGLVAGGVVAALLTAPAIADHGRLFAFKVPSLLQPLLVALGGAAILTAAWCGAAGAGRWRRARAGALAAAALALASAAVAWPALREVHEALTGWLLRRDAWLADVSEFQPFLGAHNQGWRGAHAQLGWLAYFTPVAVAAVAAGPGRRSARLLALAGLSAALLVLTLVQARFARVGVPLYAACAALGMALGARAAGRRLRRRGLSSLAAAAVGVLLLLDGPTRFVLARLPPAPLPPYLEAGLDLRDVPPPGDLDAGVLVNWTYGHQVQVLSGRPVVVNGFGSYLDAPPFWRAAEVFKGSAAALDAYLAAERVGVVVAGPGTIGAEVRGADDSSSFAGGGLNEVYMTSLPLSPLLIAGSGVPGWEVPHLPHLMPRFASRGMATGLAFRLPHLWGFERVRGARVHGTAAPGVRVLAELRFTEHERPHTYKAFTTAGADGAWSLTLPFPSDLRRPTVRAQGRWSVAAAGGAPVELDVPLAAVRAGASLDAGALPSPDAEAARTATWGGAAAGSRAGVR
jgi:dolichyl-diphosphooligosaccharide--protein glycosyltransferase